ncbi:MAG TPA: hypothetical protein VJ870_14450 [Amycolatopsis sp.]|nr:hypothetical protein [Amycolatopsis sp.]
MNRLVRQLRLLRPGRNALGRRWDRIEAVLVMVAILLCLAAVPMAVAIGSTVYNGQMAVARKQAAERHPATAITTVNAPAPPLTTPAAGEPVQVPATWTGSDGARHTGTFAVNPATPAGSPVPIWLDRHDELTLPPADQATVLGAGVGVGLLAALCCVFAAFAGLALGRFVLDHRRAVAWTRDWERFNRPPRFIPGG